MNEIEELLAELKSNSNELRRISAAQISSSEENREYSRTACNIALSIIAILRMTPENVS